MCRLSAPDLRRAGISWNRIDEKRNAANEGVISAAASRVTVRVIRTDEEQMIAETVCRILGLD